jgi:hypothetical protein
MRAPSWQRDLPSLVLHQSSDRLMDDNRCGKKRLSDERKNVLTISDEGQKSGVTH